MADINTKYSGVFGDVHLLYNAYVKPNIIPMTAVFIGVWFISPSASSAIQNGYNPLNLPGLMIDATLAASYVPVGLITYKVLDQNGLI